MAERKRRRRGVPLNDLDRSKAYVIARRGTRWEVVGEHVGPLPPSDGSWGLSGASGEAGSTDGPGGIEDGPNNGP